MDKSFVKCLLKFLLLLTKKITESSIKPQGAVEHIEVINVAAVILTTPLGYDSNSGCRSL